MTRKIWKWRMLFSLWTSSLQSFPRLLSSTRSLLIPLQSTLICMEHYSVFPNLGIHFKPTLPLVGKIWKKFSLLLPIMATAKKNFIAIRRKLDFSDRREKKLNAIRFSRARARVSKLRVGTVFQMIRISDCTVFFNSLCTFLSTVNCPEMELATIKFRRD
jgi:hypothetical protein